MPPLPPAKPAPSAPAPAGHACALALRSPKGLDDKAISAAWGTLFPQLPRLRFKAKSGAAFEFSSGEQPIAFTAVSKPIATLELALACEHAWLWRDAAAAMKAHALHLRIAAPTAGRHLDEALLVSRLAAAAARAGDPAGVLWPAGAALHKPSPFIDAVQNADAHPPTPPTPLWVGLLISARGTAGPFTLRSRGLAPFGHPELEILDSTANLADLRAIAYCLVDDLLIRNRVFAESDTLTTPQGDQFKVQLTPSKAPPNLPVRRIFVP